MAHQPESVEAVAYALFETIAYAERKDIGNGLKEAHDWHRADRHWILSTYAECLKAVKSGRAEAQSDSPEAQPSYAGWRKVPREAILASDPV